MCVCVWLRTLVIFPNSLSELTSVTGVVQGAASLPNFNALENIYIKNTVNFTSKYFYFYFILLATDPQTVLSLFLVPRDFFYSFQL